MYKLKRAKKPDILQEKSKEWTEHLIEKRKTEPFYFYWHIHEGKPLNHIIQEPLLEMTRSHCAFCDGFFEQSPVTIEHFKPKSIFPELAYEWNNLFPCCYTCQQKSDDYKDLLLKPDELEYEYEKYFYNDYVTGEIVPNPKALVKDMARAEYTIKVYNLIAEGRNQGRKRYKKHFDRDIKPDIDDYPYRYFMK
ncbi:MAG: TIGR02646 family protein [Leptospiraceae bacterium]|nr:TIGR02646 family protein [Leptospiraceae bacterium]MCP5496608.1 TIGR02646 family protein [Leptospiraceae bacterium]